MAVLAAICPMDLPWALSRRAYSIFGGTGRGPVLKNADFHPLAEALQVPNSSLTETSRASAI